jgi:Transposase domain (DUF772)
VTAYSARWFFPLPEPRSQSGHQFVILFFLYHARRASEKCHRVTIKTSFPSRLLKNPKILQQNGAECVQWHMRGTDQQQIHVFSYISPDQRVRGDHPLRPIRAMVDEVLKQLSPQFNKMYAKVGRPSIPPEQLLRAQLLQMLYSVRSERLLMEEIDYNILFRWLWG